MFASNLRTTLPAYLCYVSASLLKASEADPRCYICFDLLSRYDALYKLGGHDVIDVIGSCMMVFIVREFGLVIQYTDVVRLPRMQYESDKFLHIPQSVGRIVICRRDPVDRSVVQFA